MFLSKLRLFIFLSFLGAVAAAGTNESTSALQSLVQAEQDFAHASIEHGIRASFLQFLAEDCVVFTSAPTNGKKLYSTYPEKGGQLDWRPTFAVISRAGDLGCTAGPWSFKKSAADKEPGSFGSFVSIWKKQPDNSWKVVLDIGIDDPNARDVPLGLKDFVVPEVTIKVPLAKARSSLDLAKQALEQGLEREGFSAIGNSGAPNLLFSRVPHPGQIEDDHVKVARRSIGGEISRSGDLAYDYGSYSRDENAERGYYLSIWHLDRSASWKLLLNLQKQITPKPNESD